jgi:hypothetical protein
MPINLYPIVLLLKKQSQLGFSFTQIHSQRLLILDSWKSLKKKTFIPSETLDLVTHKSITEEDVFLETLSL